MSSTDELLRGELTETSASSDATGMRASTTSNPSDSYDGSQTIYRLLRLATWGSPLMNLGYFRFRGLLKFLNMFRRLEFAQHQLVRKAVELMGIQGNQRVLDLACGRGKSSFIMQCLHPEATVVGVDLLERHTAIAETLYGNTRNLSYKTGNAMQLDFPNESFDRMLCLEAAFHFPDRAKFLSEAFRVLRPGGRLVVVDIAWNTDADRAHRDDPEIRIVRKVWQWDDLSSVSEYERMARDLGFRVSASHNWSVHVSWPIQVKLAGLSSLTKSDFGRKLLFWRNPLFRSFSPDDWNNVAAAVAAHGQVQRYSKYMAFVFEKP